MLDATLAQPSVLIVDDERNLRRLLTHAMTTEGYHVETASNGNACLGFCQQRLPDLILMDALMPEMDGFVCCQADSLGRTAAAGAARAANSPAYPGTAPGL